MFGLSFITKLKPIKFKYNDKLPIPNDSKMHLGFIAQDLTELLDPELYGIVSKDKHQFYQVDYTELIAPLVKAVQELNVKVESLESELASYKKTV